MEVCTVDVREQRVDDVLETLREVGKAQDSIVQAVDARYVAGRRHLERAWSMAERAEERGDSIADDPAMEWLLYIAATRQIKRALSIGIQPETATAVVGILGGEETAAATHLGETFGLPTEHMGSPTHLREWFDISPEEEAATTASLEALVCERVVLLQLEA